MSRTRAILVVLILVATIVLFRIVVDVPSEWRVCQEGDEEGQLVWADFYNLSDQMVVMDAIFDRQHHIIFTSEDELFGPHVGRVDEYGEMVCVTKERD